MALFTPFERYDGPPIKDDYCAPNPLAAIDAPLVEDPDKYKHDPNTHHVKCVEMAKTLQPVEPLIYRISEAPYAVLPANSYNRGDGFWVSSSGVGGLQILHNNA